MRAITGIWHAAAVLFAAAFAVAWCLASPFAPAYADEGGAGASRTKHAVRAQDGRVRRLVPDELDQLQTFPKGWTNSGMTDGRRAFCMGNALVVSIVHRIAEEIARRAGE